MKNNSRHCCNRIRCFPCCKRQRVCGTGGQPSADRNHEKHRQGGYFESLFPAGRCKRPQGEGTQTLPQPLQEKRRQSRVNPAFSRQRRTQHLVRSDASVRSTSMCSKSIIEANSHFCLKRLQRTMTRCGLWMFPAGGLSGRQVERRRQFLPFAR